MKFNFFGGVVESRTKPHSSKTVGETVWTVIYPSQYSDEANDMHAGADEEEVNLTTLEEGRRLFKETERLRAASPHSNARSLNSSRELAVSEPDTPPAMEQCTQGPPRVYCKCKKKRGQGFCLAKEQRSGSTASVYPNKLFWGCNRRLQQEK